MVNKTLFYLSIGALIIGIISFALINSEKVMGVEDNSLIKESNSSYYKTKFLSNFFSMDQEVYLLNNSVYSFYSNKTFGEEIRYCKNFKGEEYCLTYLPRELSFRSKEKEKLISNFNSVSGIAEKNKIFYSEVYPNVDLSITAENGKVKEDYILKNFTSVPENFDDSEEVTVDFGFYLNFEGLSIYSEGQDMSGKDFITSSKIEFRKDNEVLFYFPEPIAYSENSSIIPFYEINYQEGKISLYIRTPYSFIKNSNFPVTIDPTVILDNNTGGSFPSIVLDNEAKIHTIYYGYSLNYMKYCNNTAGTWSCANLTRIEDLGSAGVFSSMAIDSNNVVHVSIYNTTSNVYDLLYCNNSGGSWSCISIVPASDYGYGNSIAIDTNNKAHISTLNYDTSDLIYCNNTASDGTWSCATVDSTGNVGNNPSIAIDSNNKVHIAEYDDTDLNLKYCNNTASNGAWSCAIIDSTGYTGYSPSIAIDTNNKVHISEYDFTNSGIKYCNNTVSDGAWSCAIILRNGGNSTNVFTSASSLILDRNNKVHISFFNNASSTKYLTYCNNTVSDGAWSCANLTVVSDSYLGYPGRGMAMKLGRIVDSTSFSSEVHGVFYNQSGFTYWNYTLITSNPFSSVWNTSKTGISNSTSISLPLESAGTYNFTVNWGDGNTETVTSYLGGNHTYSTEGTYIVNITGTINGFRFNNTGDKLKIININQWGDLQVGNNANYFDGCANLDSTATDALNLTGTTSLSYMFRNATSFNGNIDNWDTSNVTSMIYMFYFTSSFNQNLSNWNTGKVTTMERMFNGAASFNGNISNWNTANVTSFFVMFSGAASFNQDLNNWNTGKASNMGYMFQNANSFNGNISNWNTANATSFYDMFYGASSFNQDIGNWSTGKVNSMVDMFYGASSFNQNLSNWDTGNVTTFNSMFRSATNFNGNISTWNTSKASNMGRMFRTATNFNQDISNWDTSNVNNMEYLFSDADNFNQNISGWDTHNATTMTYMFNSNPAFNQDISNWDTSKVGTMSYMFAYATNFSKNIGSWNVSNVTVMTNMFQGVTLSTANYDSLLQGWSSRFEQNNTVFSGGNSKYSNCAGTGNESRNILINTYNWSITDGGWNSSYVCAIMIPPQINFTSSTPANVTTTTNTSIPINISISTSSLTNLTYNWNGINYSLYDNNLLLFMNFDNRSSLGENSTYFVDSSKYGNNGTCSGVSCPSYNSSGKYAGALSYNGNGNYIQIPNSLNLNSTTNKMTFEAYVKISTMRQQVIASKNLGSVSTGWSFGTQDTSGTLRVYISSSAVKEELTNALTANRWYHLAFVYDGTQGTGNAQRVKIYINGVLQNSSVVSGTHATSMANNNAPLTIAYGEFVPVYGWGNFSGFVDEVKIYNVSLSAAEINQHYMSNLQKYNSTQWYLQVNQSKNATAGLDTGIYTYQAFAGDVNGLSNQTEQRTVIISAGVNMSTAFSSVWNTSKNSTGSSNLTSISLPLYNGGNYNFNVNWGDGNSNTVTAWDSANANHTYSSEGTYTVNITGTIIGFRFNNAGDRLKIININQWGDLQVGNNSNYFYGCENLNSSATDALNLTGTTDLSYMFSHASSFNGNISNWDTHDVTAMDSMFFDASSFNQNIGNWDISKVIDMGQMFRDATSFNGNISNWNTSSVTSMNSMFLYATSFNQDIGNWDVSKVTNIGYMFYGAASFNQNLSNWNTNNVTVMSAIFDYASSFNGNISNWNTSGVTDMRYMFSSAINFNQNLSNWDISSVTQMDYMFQNANSFNQNLSNWDTRNVISMYNTFNNATSFNGNISSWNTSSVTNIASMFAYATSFNQNIGNWNVSSVINMTSMFSGVTLSTANYDSLLQGWSSRFEQNNTVFSGGNSKYSNCAGTGNESRNILINTYNWSITDGGWNSSYVCGGAIPGNNNWNCSTIQKFNNASCWSLGHVPIALENITFNSSGIGSCNITNNTMPQNLESFTVGADYSGTIYLAPLFAVGNWTGRNDGTQLWNVTNNISILNSTMKIYGDYQHIIFTGTQGNITKEGHGQEWNSISGNITVGTNAVLNGTGLGFTSQTGPGYNNSNGDSHGGMCGADIASSLTTYGNETAPTSLGSGGWSNSLGGSAIKLSASAGEITVNGLISMRSDNSVDNTGSGGSIWITGQSILGTGILSVLSGNSTTSWGGGGGGRIALTSLNTISFSGVINANGAIGPTNLLSGTGGTVYINAVNSITSPMNISAVGYNGSIGGRDVGQRINITAPLITLSGVHNTSAINQAILGISNGTITINYTNCASSFVGAAFAPNPIYQTLCGLEDLVYPQFSNYWDNSGSLINSGTGLINVTLLNTNGTVLLEINGTNITASNTSGSATIFNVTYNFNSAGNYSYKWHSWGNETLYNYNVSETRSYIVNNSTQQINFTNPTPANGSSQSATSVYVNVSSSDTGDHSVFLDWNKSLVGWWAMDFYNASGIYDNSSNGYFARYSGGTSNSSIVAGKRGYAVDFNGITNTLETGTINHNIATNDFTFAAWVNPKTLTGTYQGILGIGAYSPAMYTVINSGNWGAYWDTNYVSGNTLSTGQWYHLVMERKNGILAFYQNGVQTPNTYNISSKSMVNNVLHIASSGYWFTNSTIDEVMFFSRALNLSEIQSLYNASANQYYTNLTNLPAGQYNFTAYLINSAGNVNKTEQRTVTIASGTSCMYTSGNWAINLSNYCVIATNYNLGTNNISFTDNGNVTFSNCNITVKKLGALGANNKMYLNKARIIIG